jgi:glycosyltransferase involved in cell wall biosynthesis
MKDLLVISNDRIFFSKSNISSKFNDTINILDAVQKRFNIYLISRENSTKQNFLLKKSKIIKLNFKKFFFFRKINKILIISITPRNIFFFLIIKFFFKKINGFVYLRSDGYKEYKSKYGKLGSIFYDIMMKIVEGNLKIISVNKNIKTKKIHYLITPSELNDDWFKKEIKLKLDFPKLLYFGRFKKEKGVFSLIRLLEDEKFKFNLTIAGDNEKIKKKTKNIKIVRELSNQKKIINLYNKHNIFILPSYTEGSPKVVLESLARKRPVIIFDEIKHVKSNFKGIFISKRNIKDLKKTIKYILKNYPKIQKQMSQNILETKKNFQKKLIDILHG